MMFSFVAPTFLLVCFLSLKETTCQTRKKLLLFSRKSKFRTLDVQISWCHQMAKHKNKYILLNNLGSKHSMLMKFSLYHLILHKINFLSKNSTKTAIGKLALGPFVSAKN